MAYRSKYTFCPCCNKYILKSSLLTHTEGKNHMLHMNNLRNNVQLVGNIGKAPEIIYFENGKKNAFLDLFVGINEWGV